MNNKTIFRGKPIRFWIEKVFIDLTNAVKKKGGLEVLFDHSKFLDINMDGIKELTNSLDQFNSGVLTLHGYPFFIFEKNDAYKKRDPDIMIKELKKDPESVIDIFDLKSEYSVYSTENDPVEIETLIRKFQVAFYSSRGVSFDDFSNFYLEALPEIGRGTAISSGVTIKGDSRIGKNVSLFPNSFIENSIIGNDCEILPGSVIRDSELKGGNKIGPYAHLRLGSVIEKNANVGNFVEMKKSSFGTGSKAMHLSYIGDAIVGSGVNIGAGTITCNYDGEKKHATHIEDKSFIGSGTELIAPVKIGKNSYIAAGSTITDDVEDDSLAVARERQRTIKNWSKRKKKNRS